MVAIKRDVNRTLLFLVLVPIILFISFSTYYDNKLKNLSVESDKSREILATGQAVFAEANYSLKEDFFEERYSSLDSENEGLKQDRLKMEQELALTKSELQNLNDKFSRIQQQFQQVQNSLIQANEQISSLIFKNHELCRKLKEKGGEC